MMDILCVVITIVFFLIAGWVARGCEKLRRDESDD
jgi:hypothetical protein